MIGLLNVAILYIGGNKYIAGEMSIGKIADFFLYVNTLIFPFSLVGWVTSVNQRAAASMKRVNEFLNIQPSITNQNFENYAIEGNIEFKNVSYTYPNTGIEAIKNISFKLKKGEKVALMGKTGSGKTTIALLLCRFIDPTEGEILIDGKNLKNHNLNLFRQKLGYIAQENYLFSDTIEQNIGFAMDNLRPEEIKHYAKIADVDKNIVEFKDGYQTLVGERGITLSGGQKQRVCIARALIKKPEILIFDDALSALDSQTEQNILNNISSEIQNATALVITHRKSTAEKMDRIIYI